jgi:hypothetical protein
VVRIVPFGPEHADGVVSVILPIQQIEFEIPITLEAQPDLKDIRSGFREISREALPPSFPVMVVDTRFYELQLQPG